MLGLITTDGNLSKDGRHINMTSKEIEMIYLFKKCLVIDNKIGKKTREKSKEKKYFYVQFGDKNFYEYLLSIGLKPAKSKTLTSLKIEDKYFQDFLRGCIDGDGNINIFTHPESKNKQLRIRLFYASKDFLSWIQKEILYHCDVKGGWVETRKSVSVLTYAKKDSIILLNFMYYKGVKYYLKRKNKIAKDFLRT